MQKLIETLRNFGIEVPEDKISEVKKAISENYKHIGEVSKATGKLEAERDNWKQRAETAEETLKSFEGIDPAKLNDEIATWKKKAEEAEQNAQKRLEERDFNDALKAELDGIEFTSAAARKAVEAEIRGAGLKLGKSGKILGLSDMLEQMRADDASAFVDKQQQQLEQNKARFSGAPTAPQPGKKMSLSDLMKFKNENPGIDIKNYM